MECAGAFLTLIVLLAMAYVANTHAQEERRRVEHALRSVAQQRGGMFRRGTWFRPPSACFRHRGRLARVEAARIKSGWRFETLIEAPAPVPNCQIDALSPMATFFMAMPQRAEFSRRYRIRCADEAACERLLSDGVRAQIEQLRTAGDVHELSVAFQDGCLAVAKPARRVAAEVAREVVGLTIELYEQVALTQNSSIAFTSPQVAVSLIKARCQVCGDAAVGEMVLCRRCKSPHHLDCWTFIGACSVFGCACDECDPLLTAVRAE